MDWFTRIKVFISEWRATIETLTDKDFMHYLKYERDNDDSTEVK